MELQEKIKLMFASGIYNINRIAINTGISRYLLSKIINGEDVPNYIYVALNDYLSKVGTKDGNN